MYDIRKILSRYTFLILQFLNLSSIHFEIHQINIDDLKKTSLIFLSLSLSLSLFLSIFLSL